MTLKEGSLFAGYHGLGMGVSSVLDAEPVWFSEYDKGPSKILAHRFPDIPNHGDITKIDWSQVEPVDILTGGSPCQDLSHAGARKGMTEGTRSNLWVAMREAIAQLRPGLVVWENVGGAFSANASSEVEPCAGCVGDGSGTHLRALGRVLGDLSSLGYDARWVALRAADVGAPHGRLRVFVTAYPAADAGRFTREIPASGGLATVAIPASDGDSRRTLLPTPTAASDGNTPETHLARKPGRTEVTNLEVMARGGLLPTPRAGDGEKGGPNQRGSSGDFMLPSAVVQLLPTTSVADVTGGRKSRSGDRSGELLLNGIAAAEAWGQYAAAIQRWESLTRTAPAPTELGPKGNPRLSAAFSEWMMGLPAGWVTDVPGITRNESLKALGNGVVPQQCAAALRYLLAAGEVAA